MLACLDVFYAGSTATAACIVFDGWTATAPAEELVRQFTDVAEYEPGNFYKRELPCLIGTIERLSRGPQTIIVDGYVWLSSDGRPGLGAHLFASLDRSTPVIGVAKSAFPGAPAVKVYRGQSKTPLHVTAAGVDVARAAENIRSMAGAHRIPDMLRLVDRLGRDAAVGLMPAADDAQ
jgi:deoxyribonuclease V